MALCQQYNYGYKTVFDRNVDRFYTEITPRVNYAVSRPSAEDYGFFMKEVCTALGQPSIGGVGIVAHMRAQTQLVLVESGRLPDGVLYIYIKYATSAGCMPYDTWLPPVVQMSG